MARISESEAARILYDMYPTAIQLRAKFPEMADFLEGEFLPPEFTRVENSVNRTRDIGPGFIVKRPILHGKGNPPITLDILKTRQFYFADPWLDQLTHFGLILPGTYHMFNGGNEGNRMFTVLDVSQGSHLIASVNQPIGDVSHPEHSTLGRYASVVVPHQADLYLLAKEPVTFFESNLTTLIAARHL